MHQHQYCWNGVSLVVAQPHNSTISFDNEVRSQCPSTSQIHCPFWQLNPRSSRTRTRRNRMERRDAVHQILITTSNNDVEILHARTTSTTSTSCLVYCGTILQQRSSFFQQTQSNASHARGRVSTYQLSERIHEIPGNGEEGKGYSHGKEVTHFAVF